MDRREKFVASPILMSTLKRLSAEGQIRPLLANQLCRIAKSDGRHRQGLDVNK